MGTDKTVKILLHENRQTEILKKLYKKKDLLPLFIELCFPLKDYNYLPNVG